MNGSRAAAPTEYDMVTWGWGADWQLWACRVSHVLGLVAVLAMLLLLGIVSSGW